MPFYDTDNISAYLFACITEHHEALDKDELRENYEMLDNAVLTSRALYDVCEGFLENEIVSNTNLFKAVMNSIDMDWLCESLEEWLQSADQGEDVEDDSESQTEYDPVPVPEKFKQGQAEIDAKFEEMKALIKTKEEAYATLAKIASELNDLSKS